MNISPTEAEEALTAIQGLMERTRHSIASSGAHVSLIITGIVWLIGFICNQFLSGEILSYIWIGLSILGGTTATILGIRNSKHIRNPSASATAKRISLIWLLLVIYCIAAIAVAYPIDGKQLTMFIVLFVLIGWMAMGLLLSFSSFWPGLLIIVMALVGYFFLSNYFYLWMGILVGGGMIVFGLYIRYRW